VPQSNSGNASGRQISGPGDESPEDVDIRVVDVLVPQVEATRKGLKQKTGDLYSPSYPEKITSKGRSIPKQQEDYWSAIYGSVEEICQGGLSENAQIVGEAGIIQALPRARWSLTERRR
jgi:hypothetical protein